MKKRSKIIGIVLAIVMAVATTAYFSGCGSGVDFGTRKFTLTGAGQ